MKSKESIFTKINLYFITFPRQTFVNIIDNETKEKDVLHGLLCSTSSYLDRTIPITSE